MSSLRQKCVLTFMLPSFLKFLKKKPNRTHKSKQECQRESNSPLSNKVGQRFLLDISSFWEILMQKCCRFSQRWFFNWKNHIEPEVSGQGSFFLQQANFLFLSIPISK